MSLKVLVPVRVGLKHNTDEYRVGGSQVTDGIGKFINHLNEFLDIHPVYITKEDRKTRNTKNIIKKAIYDISPDLVITNEIDYSCAGYFQEFHLPLISVIHEPRSMDIRMVSLGEKLDNIVKNQGHVYFVSDHQLDSYKKLFKRTYPVDTSQFKGIINPSYCDFDDVKVRPTTMPIACTIGRAEKIKDPFFVHRKFNKSNIASIVMTGKTNDEYARENNWDNPFRYTYYNIPHKEVIKKLVVSTCFVSTCPYESWGITAMESFCCGVPVILTTDKTGKHSSESIAADPSHYVKLKKSASQDDYVKTVEKFYKLFIPDREKIAEMSREKHSRENFRRQIETMIDRRLDDKVVAPPTLF